MWFYKNIFDFFKNNNIPINMILLRNYVKENIVINPKYELLTDQTGLLKLMPIGDRFNYYRGQVEEINPCLSSIDRIKNDQDIKLSRLKSIELEYFYKNTSLFLEQENLLLTIFGKEYRYIVDYLSLAQHYNIPTEYLDLTNNLLIASFFATNRYEYDSDKFIPMKGGNGIIYKYMDLSENRATILGLQPFPRPGEQKAFAIKLNKMENFSNLPFVQKIVFEHSEECSEFLYDLFDKGKILFPDDPISKTSRIINSTNVFSNISLRKLHKRYFHNITCEELKVSFEEKGINFSDILPSLSTDESSIIDTYWEKSKKYLMKSPTGKVLYVDKA